MVEKRVKQCFILSVMILQEEQRKFAYEIVLSPSVRTQSSDPVCDGGIRQVLAVAYAPQL